MHNALELDAGRYVHGGSSATILYATRLALRVGLYARAALAPEARAVRGLRHLSDTTRRALAEGSEALRPMVEPPPYAGYICFHPSHYPLGAAGDGPAA